MRVSFNTDRSVEDVIRENRTREAPIVGTSYFVMLIYVIVALGEVSSCRTFCRDVKVTKDCLSLTSYGLTGIWAIIYYVPK